MCDKEPQKLFFRPLESKKVVVKCICYVPLLQKCRTFPFTQTVFRQAVILVTTKIFTVNYVQSTTLYRYNNKNVSHMVRLLLGNTKIVINVQNIGALTCNHNISNL